VKRNHDDLGHVSFGRCVKASKEQYWFAKMTRFIGNYCGSWLQCAYGKGNYGKKEGKLHPIRKPDKPMDTFHIDLCCITEEFSALKVTKHLYLCISILFLLFFLWR
jgi:hypothetical protein